MNNPGESFSFPVQGFAPAGGFAGQNPTNPANLGGAFSPDAIQAGINPQSLGGGQAAAGIAYAPAYQAPIAAHGVVSLVNLVLRYLDEVNLVAGRILEHAQTAEARQGLWQIQQLAGQARAHSYQIRGMLLQ
ncbi:MAG: hypothetical protein ACM3X6_06920 [Patescibacteria group bacterium]